MSKTTAGNLREIWSRRLQMGKLSTEGQDFARLLVKRLDHLDASELIEVDAVEGRRPLARMTQISNGEILAELQAET